MLSSGRINGLIFGLCLLAPWSLLWLDASLLFPYETGKAWVFRSIVELAFGLLIYQLLSVSNVSLLPGTGKRLLPFVLLIFLIWSLLANITGIDPYHSFWSNYERMAGGMAYLHWAMYFLCLAAVLNEKHIKIFLLNILMTISIVCLLGLFESEKRIISTLGNPIYLGNLAVLGLFLLGFVVSAFSCGPSKRRGLVFALALFAATIMGLALLNTASRGPFLGLVAGCVAFTVVMLTGFIRRFNLRGKLLIAGSFLLISSIIVSQLDTLQGLLRQSDNYAMQRIGRISMEDQTTADRLENWRIALSAAKQHPALGWGQENYVIAFTEHYRAGVMDDADIWFDRAHNAYLDVLLASGIPSFLLYCLLLGLPLLIVSRSTHCSRWQTAFAGGFLVAFMAKNLVGMDTFSSTLLWISFLAVILAPHTTHFTEQSSTTQPPKIIALLSVLALSLLCIYGFNIKPYQDNRYLASVVEKPIIFGQDGFESWMEQASKGEPYSANAKLALFDQLLTKVYKKPVSKIQSEHYDKLFQQAGELITAELNRQPRNYRIKYNGSLLLARLGHYDLAIKLLAELTVAAPQRTVFWHSLAQVYAAAGNTVEEARARANVNQLNPKWGL